MAYTQIKIFDIFRYIFIFFIYSIFLDDYKMKSNFTRLTKFQGSPYYRGLNLWDRLPDDIQEELDE